LPRVERFLLGWPFRQEKAMKMILKAMLAATALAAFASASYAGGRSPLQFVAGETKADLKAMEGKRVLGKSGELLGQIGKVDEQAKTAELKTPSGVIVSLSTDVLVEDGDMLSAPLSRGDILAMIDRPGQESNIREAGAKPSP
jgi:hypothetical protein